ncbi:MAG TPA: YhcH/YjgK/YiaL family protein [Pirellulales bacterium]|jgi:YhcH/YjgK/YiaL family protein|nr:YhcH/YjgK/YiaL family protein [Pirellulales bacterium]
MILDRLEQATLYNALHPLFGPAFAYLRETDLAALAMGKHPIDGDRLFAIAARDEGRTRAGAKLEAHRAYIDIQYVVEGCEVMGWRPTAECSLVESPFEPARDIGFFADAPKSWFEIPSGSFTILWPSDAHAPLAGEGALHKVVLKVAVAPGHIS